MIITVNRQLQKEDCIGVTDFDIYVTEVPILYHFVQLIETVTSKFIKVSLALEMLDDLGN